MAEGGGVWVVRSRPIPNMVNPSDCLALKLYKLKFNCLQAAYNAAASFFFSLQNEVRQLQWVGIFHRIQDSRCSGLRTQNGDTNHMAAGGKTNAVAGFACNLQFAPLFKL